MVHSGGADLEIQQLYAQWEELQLQDGILYRNFLGTDDQVRWNQLLVTRSPRTELLHHLHAEPTASHLASGNTGQGDENGLMEGMEGRRGAVL